MSVISTTGRNIYPLADRLVQADYDKLGVSGMATGFFVGAVRTSEAKRIPRLGEWFLSGAFVEAYRANTQLMSIEYPIARLVVYRKLVQYVIDS